MGKDKQAFEKRIAKEIAVHELTDKQTTKPAKAKTTFYTRLFAKRKEK